MARPAAGEQVQISDVVLREDGHLYYRLSHPALETAYIATENAPHFCGYVVSLQPDATPFAAPPKSRHLIAASRCTIDEENAFIPDRTHCADGTIYVAVLDIQDDHRRGSAGGRE